MTHRFNIGEDEYTVTVQQFDKEDPSALEFLKIVQVDSPANTADFTYVAFKLFVLRYAKTYNNGNEAEALEVIQGEVHAAALEQGYEN
jgi:hypothetical protein